MRFGILIPERGHVLLHTMLFEALPGDRTKLTIHSVFRSLSDRDGMMQTGVEKGELRATASLTSC
ncbi:MAG TPA: hypothetical protein PLR06_02385 [Cyclobacteriaceae bacterium]|nr:hypothetical protein [Cyclobacteriaceae bacterium]